MPINRVCLNCSKPFTVKPSRVLNGRGKCCSNACLYKYMSRAQITFTCPICGKVKQLRKCYASSYVYCSFACRRIAGLPRKQAKAEARIAEQIQRDTATEKRVTIYALWSGGRRIYVGRTREGREHQRLKEHRCRGYLAGYSDLEMEILTVVRAELWRDQEKFWIWRCGEDDMGNVLLNKHPGGQGAWPREANVQKTCLHCGKEFTVVPSAANSRNNCSKECQYASWIALRHKGVVKPPRGPDITSRCPGCDKDFTHPYYRRNQKFCGHSCSMRFYRAKQKEARTHPQSGE